MPLVRELNAVLDQRGVDYTGVIEKEELEKLVRESEGKKSSDVSHCKQCVAQAAPKAANDHPVAAQAASEPTSDPMRLVTTAPSGMLPLECNIVCGSGLPAPMASMSPIKLIAGDARVVERWLSDEGGDVNARTGPHNETMLMLASAHGHMSLVKLCLDHSADVNAVAKDGYAALHRAVMYARTSIVELLIARRADVTAIAHGGRNSVLSELCHGGSTDPPPSGNGSPGQPLPLVRDAEHEKLVKILVDAKADVDHRDHQYMTPLMLASAKGRTSIVSAMLAAGANRTLKDRANQTARDWARDRGHNDVEFALMAKYEQDTYCIMKNVVDHANKSAAARVACCGNDDEDNVFESKDGWRKVRDPRVIMGLEFVGGRNGAQNAKHRVFLRSENGTPIKLDAAGVCYTVCCLSALRDNGTLVPDLTVGVVKIKFGTHTNDLLVNSSGGAMGPVFDGKDAVQIFVQPGYKQACVAAMPLLEADKKGGSVISSFPFFASHFSGSRQVRTCSYCGQSGHSKAIQACGRCLGLYCSKECQRADWKAGHKKVCKQAAPAGTTAPVPVIPPVEPADNG